MRFELVLIGGSFHREKHYHEYYVPKIKIFLPSKINVFDKKATFTQEEIQYENYIHHRIKIFDRTIENIYFFERINPEEFIFNILKDYFR